jgi:hypothetical protein
MPWQLSLAMGGLSGGGGDGSSPLRGSGGGGGVGPRRLVGGAMVPGLWGHGALSICFFIFFQTFLLRVICTCGTPLP